MQKDIAELKHHMIVCGYGRMGRLVAANLLEAGRDVVVIDHHPETAEEAKERGFLVFQGNATEEETLFDPGPETRILADDTLLAIGSCEANHAH